MLYFSGLAVDEDTIVELCEKLKNFTKIERLKL